MKIIIADGRGALWQWDTGRRVKIIDGADVKQIHYQNRCFGRSVDVGVEDDGTAIIPDELLQDYHTLTAYAYVTEDAGGYTKVQHDFAVYKRPKPADYVYTPTERAGFDKLRDEIGDLADLTTEAKENLVAAINEAVASGGSGSMDLRVADGYIQYSTDSGSTWQNLIAVADLKGAGMDITGATVGQIAKIAAVDDSGKPTAWEPVDMPSGGGGGGAVTTLHINVTAVNIETMETTFTADKTVTEMQQASVNGPIWCVVTFAAGVISGEALSRCVPPAWDSMNTVAFGSVTRPVHGIDGENDVTFAVEGISGDEWVIDLTAFAGD